MVTFPKKKRHRSWDTIFYILDRKQRFIDQITSIHKDPRIHSGTEWKTSLEETLLHDLARIYIAPLRLLFTWINDTDVKELVMALMPPTKIPTDTILQKGYKNGLPY